MRWVDHVNEDPPDADTFFDRVVSVILDKEDIGAEDDLEDHTVLTIGLLLNNQTVVTSYNPFREHVKKKEARMLIKVVVLRIRQITDWSQVQYGLMNCTVACARQVIPVADADQIWHTPNEKKQSPLHDLMVIRLKRPLKLIDPNPSLYSFDNYDRRGKSLKIVGPIITELATPNTTLTSTEIKFASISFLSKSHISKSCKLRSHTFLPDDKVEVDCDRWLPRQWGWFICIRNLERFKSVGSGAILVQDNKVFGIGSFMLAKGKKSILVFTDVRKYYNLLFKTCTLHDQNLGVTTTTEAPTTEAPTTDEPTTDEPITDEPTTSRK